MWLLTICLNFMFSDFLALGLDGWWIPLVQIFFFSLKFWTWLFCNLDCFCWTFNVYNSVLIAARGLDFSFQMFLWISSIQVICENLKQKFSCIFSWIASHLPKNFFQFIYLFIYSFFGLLLKIKWTINVVT